MIITLAGYMGSGKSHISKLLSDSTGFLLTDLDREIARQSGMTVSEIFEKKGELYFRKIEKEILHSLIETPIPNRIISLGGGTPCYYDNIEVINQHTVSIYLKASVSTLAERLAKQKEKRPLLAKKPTEELHEFIAKHLFERSYYYHQCQFTVACDNKTPLEIVNEIKNLLPHLH